MKTREAVRTKWRIRPVETLFARPKTTLGFEHTGLRGPERCQWGVSHAGLISLAEHQRRRP
ncbi:hypothetical protein BQ8794_30118 [Mesorhizobium prunaredense]|uniref:Transposase n=1 Tax=Mesorhizobium prunaredense TaxID=1631249 RepID=A0A1R3V9W8_9HYPH|nr:hypothetical protein BQ8794_30118 [Mesorhizobium prunaredense]